MHTVPLPKGVPAEVWCELMRETWSRSFERAGFPCIEVWIESNSVVIYDPHKHLNNSSALNLVLREIMLSTENTLALIMSAPLLAGR